MQGRLDELGVKVIALSKDSVEDAAKHKHRDKIALTLLADPELTVIRQYGLEHHKAIEFSTGSFSLFGLPLAIAPSVKTMAIPTSLLVDEHGVIQWVDQAEDYRLRSSELRVMEAVRRAFGGGDAATPAPP